MPVSLPPGAERCAATGSCGAGATTLLGPIFISPSRRAEEASTEGGGAIRSGWSPAMVACALDARTSGGGATTEVCRVGEGRRGCSRAASGGGVTTEFSGTGAMRRISAAGTSGMSGIASFGFCCRSDQATILGIATSRFSFTLGGATIVWERLSASRGTEIMG